MSVSPRIAVTGRTGQLVSCLLDRAGDKAQIIALGRPQLDLSEPESVEAALREARPDVIINAAAYTAVDKAEQDREYAMRVNGAGAGAVARAAHRLGKPLLHISTDYVFNGALDRPYRESDPVDPINSYGSSKLEGKKRVAAECANSAILRISWVYSPFGANFVRTMARLAQTKEEVSVVADQIGNPTSALDVADALLTIAARLQSDDSASLRGLFHMSGTGDTSWADFAQAIFDDLQDKIGRRVRVRPIGAIDYPTPARRPTNSRLETSKLRAVYGISLPDWRDSLRVCLKRIPLDC